MQHSSRLPSPYRDETQHVDTLLDHLSNALNWAQVRQAASPWVQAVRDNPPPFWAMESLLKEYPISSAEGLALMRLAEALLRVPDTQTAIALTADQLGRADFDGASDKALGRLSSAAIAMSKHFLPEGDNPPNLMGRLGAKAVVSASLRAVQLLGKQFVLGQTIDDAMQEANGARKQQKNLRFSYDMLGEGARTKADAQRYFASYQNAIKHIAQQSKPNIPTEHNDGISIKLSALHPRYEALQHEQVMRELVPQVCLLCQQAAQANINLTIDAEEVDRLELSLDVFEALAKSVSQQYPQWQGLGLAMQAYQTRALDLIGHIIDIARRYGIRLMCRLVKGAYWDAEIKRAQELGLAHYPVFTHKHHTDISYLACAQALLKAPDAIYPQFATHNAGTIAAIIQMAQRNQAPFELQRLHGMGEGVYREVLAKPELACRVYAPVGQHRDLLAYLVRRLLENGANSSFVHQLADESLTMDVLLESPLHCDSKASLPLPEQLFVRQGEPVGTGRRNSSGLDLAVAEMRTPLQAAYEQLKSTQQGLHAAGLVNTAEQALDNNVVNGVAVNVADSVDKAVAAFASWSKTTVAHRAAILNTAADQMQAQLPQLCALLVDEAHKTWSDTIAEVREAIDFLRYYALEAQTIMQPKTLPGPTGESNTLMLQGRGAWVCISPWNFPLAIFVGQVAAALVTGNTVLAKPAEQTPEIARAAVALLHAAGVPKEVLQLLPGAGDTVGAALVAHPDIAGVVFTGSTQVAKLIQRALAAKEGAIVPLIAETGGINAMLVDSSALPEQVVDAVVQSAFKSAGQRCSALRLLCVHEGIADHVIEMIVGAARELQVDNAAQWSCDVGPVIDDEAFNTIHTHIARLKQTAQTVHYAPDLLQGSHTVPPQVFELAQIAQVRQEIFGPVLHIVRWSGDPQAVMAQINALGYGLTLGLQTRIDSRALALAQAAHIGNVYINRNMIGAVVGVQPFGGEGLSGTGPKAGGPYYLYRFCAERTLTINTTAAGGNVALFT